MSNILTAAKSDELGATVATVLIASLTLLGAPPVRSPLRRVQTS
jgi:hypothetical protein